MTSKAKPAARKPRRRWWDFTGGIAVGQAADALRAQMDAHAATRKANQ